ncbi:hypothetical protein B0H17DRAFT_1135514 [Mycena rosella]|uniref:Uncharacterized protein n=1 Tax=Mycena rosella TaxID=1033263 RepID=A0AAD7DCM5_MYCRO|nr:hypothetical protein B0H17DRAFT_1135514 [Mycena rosella]
MAGSGSTVPPPASKPAPPLLTLLMAWLLDDTDPIRCLLAADAGGYVCLADHKIELGELSLEQQRPLEKYSVQDNGSMGWTSLRWDTPVYCEAGRPMLVRYGGVKNLAKWDVYVGKDFGNIRCRFEAVDALDMYWMVPFTEQKMGAQLRKSVGRGCVGWDSGNPPPAPRSGLPAPSSRWQLALLIRGQPQHTWWATGEPTVSAAAPIKGAPPTTGGCTSLELRPSPSPNLTMKLLPDDIIDKPLSLSDKPGDFYDFLIPDDNAKVVKFGRMAYPARRRQQWARQCRGQPQRWQYRWEVPFTAKLGASISFYFPSSCNSSVESLIHEHFKRAGAWLGPSKCEFCPVSHCEKYEYRRCGGRDTVIEVVEAYLRRLGWLYYRTPRQGEFMDLTGNSWTGGERINAFNRTLTSVVLRQNRSCWRPPCVPRFFNPNCRWSGLSAHALAHATHTEMPATPQVKALNDGSTLWHLAPVISAIELPMWVPAQIKKGAPGFDILEYVKGAMFDKLQARVDNPKAYAKEILKDYINGMLFPLVEERFHISETYNVAGFQKAMYRVLNNKRSYGVRKATASAVPAPAPTPARTRRKGALDIFKELNRDAIKAEVDRVLDGVDIKPKDGVVMNATHAAAKKLFEGGTEAVQQEMSEKAETWNLKQEEGPSAESVATAVAE